MIESVSVPDSLDWRMDSNLLSFEATNLGYPDAHPLYGTVIVFGFGFRPSGSGSGKAVLKIKASGGAGTERGASSSVMTTCPKYLLLNMEQRNGNTRIECVCVPRIGKDIVWEALVDFKDSADSYDGSRQSVHLSDLPSSYGSPQLTKIFDDQALLTAGEINVTLLAYDFKPVGTDIAVPYGPNQHSGSVWFRFEAVTCANSLDSTHAKSLFTTSPAGVANRIVWKLSTTGAQSSNIPPAGFA